MNALPFIIGGGVIALIVAASAKANASTKPSGSTPKPSGSTPKPSGSTTPAGTVGGPGTTTPEYLSSVPYVIAMRVIQLSDPSLQQAQGSWLTDNGFPLTGEAVQQYSRGEITDLQLRQIAQAEFKANAAKPPTSATKPKGTTAADTYGTYLLNSGTDDELYSYALTSTSIPFVTQSAARLAAAGDTRAAALTQHLADLTT